METAKFVEELTSDDIRDLFGGFYDSNAGGSAWNIQLRTALLAEVWNAFGA